MDHDRSAELRGPAGVAGSRRRPGRLADRIVTDFLRRIASGELVPGAAIPTEDKLCEEYRVSRTAIREAMRALAVKGFVAVRQGSGTVVEERSKWSALDPEFLRLELGESRFWLLHEAREALEPTLAARAAVNRSDEEILTLRHLLRRHHETPHTDPVAHTEIDMAFHEALAQAAHNPVLAAMHSQLTSLGREWRSEAASRVPGAIGRAEAWHSLLVDAVEAQDQERAVEAMAGHLQQVREELQAAFPNEASAAIRGQ